MKKLDHAKSVLNYGNSLCIKTFHVWLGAEESEETNYSS
jgi:hypothetical protein